jgi:hypothetical protein
MRPSILEELLTSKFCLPFLEDKLPVLQENVPLHLRQELWLQQDGTPPYFGRQITAFLTQNFQDCRIEWQGSVARPLRSLDLTSLLHYHWRPMKSLVYAVKLSTRAELLSHMLDVSAHCTHKKGQTLPYEVCCFIFTKGHNVHR